jgi:hypothetical protein
VTVNFMGRVAFALPALIITQVRFYRTSEGSEMRKEIELQTKLTGVSRGTVLPLPYHCSLHLENGRYQLRVLQPYKDGGMGSVGQWSLLTLLADCRDTLAIDFGQRWEVIGMRQALQEAAYLVVEEYEGAILSHREEEL